MTRAPDFITFTGIDDATPVDRLVALSARYPIEWGVLLDPARQVHVPRFPSDDTLRRIAETDLRLAGHLCWLLTDAVQSATPVAIAIPFARFDRLQINSSTLDIERAAAFGQLYGRRAILPCGGAAFPASAAVDWLHDLSGGRGVTTQAWPPHPGRLVGYAGGIGPHNVAAVLDAVDARGSYWIDMETHIRTGDRLDLDLCEKVCQIVYPD